MRTFLYYFRKITQYYKWKRKNHTLNHVTKPSWTHNGYFPFYSFLVFFTSRSKIVKQDKILKNLLIVPLIFCCTTCYKSSIWYLTLPWSQNILPLFSIIIFDQHVEFSLMQVVNWEQDFYHTYHIIKFLNTAISYSSTVCCIYLNCIIKQNLAYLISL